MLGLFRKAFALVVCFLCMHSNASSSLSHHVLAVSQSMSAFYMYSLSEGDERYKTEYENYFDQAEMHLQAILSDTSETYADLQIKWQRLRPLLKYDYVAGAGFVASVAVRSEFREYLSTVYSLLSDVTKSKKDSSAELLDMGLMIELMCARFFDVSSSLYGNLSVISDDPIKLSRGLNLRLEQALKKSIPMDIKNNIRKVQTKWKFIEDSVVNYKGEAAYLLVYFNKSKITELLMESRVELANM